MVVLIDHCDYISHGVCGMRCWTLMGLGFSDSSEVFVLLSGIVLGWGYGQRLPEIGPVKYSIRMSVRLLKLYAAYLVVVGFAFCLGSYVNESTMRTSLDLSFSDHSVLLLRDQPFGSSILCLYLVATPIVVVLLYVSKKCLPLGVFISILLYVISQGNTFDTVFKEHLWRFSPLSWQLLMFTGGLAGLEMRRNRKFAISTSVRFFAFSLLLLSGSAFKFIQYQESNMHWERGWLELNAFIGEFTSKQKLGLLRFLHGVCLAILYLSPYSTRILGSRNNWLSDLEYMGRNSLLFYVIGVGVVYLFALICSVEHDSPFFTFLSVLGAVTCQISIANLLRRFANHRDMREVAFNTIP